MPCVAPGSTRNALGQSIDHIRTHAADPVAGRRAQDRRCDDVMLLRCTCPSSCAKSAGGDVGQPVRCVVRHTDEPRHPAEDRENRTVVRQHVWCRYCCGRIVEFDTMARICRNASLVVSSPYFLRYSGGHNDSGGAGHVGLDHRYSHGTLAQAVEAVCWGEAQQARTALTLCWVQGSLVLKPRCRETNSQPDMPAPGRRAEFRSGGWSFGGSSRRPKWTGNRLALPTVERANRTA